MQSSASRVNGELRELCGKVYFFSRVQVKIRNFPTDRHDLNFPCQTGNVHGGGRVVLRPGHGSGVGGVAERAPVPSEPEQGRHALRQQNLLDVRQRPRLSLQFQVVHGDDQRQFLRQLHSVAARPAQQHERHPGLRAAHAQRGQCVRERVQRRALSVLQPLHLRGMRQESI